MASHRDIFVTSGQADTAGPAFAPNLRLNEPAGIELAASGPASRRARHEGNATGQATHELRFPAVRFACPSSKTGCGDKSL
jgi:hypothetical protein